MPNIKITKRHDVVEIHSDDSDFDLPLPGRKPQVIDLSRSPGPEKEDKSDNESQNESQNESESENESEKKKGGESDTEKERKRQQVKNFQIE